MSKCVDKMMKIKTFSRVSVVSSLLLTLFSLVEVLLCDSWKGTLLAAVANKLGARNVGSQNVGRALRRCGKLSSDSVKVGGQRWGGEGRRREDPQPGFEAAAVYSVRTRWGRIT